MYMSCTCLIRTGGGPLPNILQEANIDVLSESECQDEWGSRISNIHICLTDRENGARGACNVSIPVCSYTITSNVSISYM